MRRSIEALQKDVIHCRRCPRLVEYRERVSRGRTRRFENETYWGRPVPGFGDPRARLLVVGLAPAAHGGNRTGRVFTGDRSGDWLFEALNRYGFANQPESTHRGDGLELSDCYVTAGVRCAPPHNKPTAEERDNCHPYLVNELKILKRVRVVICLGRFAFDVFLAAREKAGQEIPHPKPRFDHGASHQLPGPVTLMASYHPSQQNTFTGRLTRRMFHSVFRKARRQLD